MEWRTVARLPAYEISDTGILRHRLTQRLPKVNYNRYGIPRYYLYDKNCAPKKQRVIYKRNLVADAFVPNPNHCTLVRHKDGDIQNCNASNLEWIAGD